MEEVRIDVVVVVKMVEMSLLYDFITWKILGSVQILCGYTGIMRE